MAETLLLIDASSSIYRAFFALPSFGNSKGVPTNATLGFTTMLQKVLRDTSPDYVVVAWDAPGRKRRKELSKAYKATREATPDDLRAQLPYIREVVAAYGLNSMEYEGEEADDVIATLTRLAADRNLDVLIVSTDKDLMQLVGPRVTLLDTMKDRSIGPQQVEERFGVPPEQVLDLRALTGDSSDNIPGVRGVGEKTAAKLIREFGSLDALLEKAETIKAKGQREKILAGAEDARLSRELARLREDLPLALELEKSKSDSPDRGRLVALFQELEFKRLLEELDVDVVAAPATESPAVESQRVADAAALAALAVELDRDVPLSLELILEPDDAMRGEGVAIGLATSDRAAHVVVCEAVGAREGLEVVRPVFERERVWSGWDLKGAALFLARHGIELAGELRDVPLAAYVADSS